MNNQTARLIITLDCNRHCYYCCNTKENLAKAIEITDLSEIDMYKEVCITGGEPMLNPMRTCDIVESLQRTDRIIYLYTALVYYRHLQWMLLNGLSGIHYTLHYTSEKADIEDGVRYVEKLAEEFPDKSFRLYIDPDVKGSVTITPNRWTRVEVKPWLNPCPLIPNEDLFILK